MGGRLRVEVNPTAVRLRPGGGSATVRVDVYNGTSLVDEFWIGAPSSGDWLQIAPATLRLFPETSGTAELTLAIPAGVAAPAGDHALALTTQSASDRGVRDVQHLRVSVDVVVADQSLVVEPQVLRGGGDARARVVVRNGSNTDLWIRLHGSDPEGVLAFAFEPETLQVPAFAQAVAWVSVSANRPVGGTEKTRNFSIHAQGAAQNLSSAGVFVQQPVVTGRRVWGARLALTAVGALVILAAALLAILHVTKEPEAWGALDWTYWELSRAAFLPGLRPPGSLETILDSELVSLGAILTLLAGLVIAGAFTRKGRLTTVGALLAVALVIIFLVTLWIGAGRVLPDVAAFMVLVGAVVALIGARLARR